MIKPTDFKYLDVATCIPPSFWTNDAQQVFSQLVGDKGRGNFTGRLNRNGVLQVCVGGIQPFDTESGDTIYILRKGGRNQPRICATREALIEAVADDLLRFEEICTTAEKTLCDVEHDVKSAVKIVDEQIQIVKRKNESLEKWEDLKARILKRWEPHILPTGRNLGARKEIALQILTDLAISFDTYGPKPKMAGQQTYRAIGAILKRILSDRGAQIGVIDKTSTIEDLANMIKKRINRKNFF